jgi:hypothetical protein
MSIKKERNTVFQIRIGTEIQKTVTTRSPKNQLNWILIKINANPQLQPQRPLLKLLTKR